MNKMKAGFIGFIPFGSKDVYSVLESYVKIGYRGFEGGDMLLRQGDAHENLAKVKAFGMEPLSTGLGLRPGQPIDLSCVPTVIEKAKKLGVKRAATFHSAIAAARFHDIPGLPTYDETMREIEGLNAAAKELAKEGIVTTFHNHDAEFLTYYKGKSAFDYMVENSDYLKFELDCGWAQYAQVDPIKVMEKLGDKFQALHIKDYTLGNIGQEAKPGVAVDESRPRFTTPGTGELKLRACLEKALEMGIDYAIVEQDFMNNLTLHETLTAAYLNMKETGFVE